MPFKAETRIVASCPLCGLFFFDGKCINGCGTQISLVVAEDNPKCKHRAELLGTDNCDCLERQNVYQCKLHNACQTRRRFGLDIFPDSVIPMRLIDSEKVKAIAVRYCSECPDSTVDQKRLDQVLSDPLHRIESD